MFFVQTRSTEIGWKRRVCSRTSKIYNSVYRFSRGFFFLQFIRYNAHGTHARYTRARIKQRLLAVRRSGSDVRRVRCRSHGKYSTRTDDYRRCLFGALSARRRFQNGFSRSRANDVTATRLRRDGDGGGGVTVRARFTHV